MNERPTPTVQRVFVPVETGLQQHALSADVHAGTGDVEHGRHAARDAAAERRVVGDHRRRDAQARIDEIDHLVDVERARDVAVQVDEARTDPLVRRVEHLVTGRDRDVARRADRLDQALAHEDHGVVDDLRTLVGDREHLLRADREPGSANLAGDGGASVRRGRLPALLLRDGGDVGRRLRRRERSARRRVRVREARRADDDHRHDDGADQRRGAPVPLVDHHSLPSASAS
jgi:hypothetical protein